MQARRGRRVVDTDPQSIPVSSSRHDSSSGATAPLLAITTSAPSLVATTAASLALSSGAVGGGEVGALGDGAVAQRGGGAPVQGTAPPPAPFSIPAAVLKRMAAGASNTTTLMQSSQLAAPTIALEATTEIPFGSSASSAAEDHATSSSINFKRRSGDRPARPSAAGKRGRTVPSEKERGGNEIFETVSEQEVSDNISVMAAARAAQAVRRSGHPSSGAPAALLADSPTLKKPLIYTSQWRRKMKLANATSSPASFVPLEQQEREMSDEDGDDVANPFGGGDVIKFERAIASGEAAVANRHRRRNQNRGGDEAEAEMERDGDASSTSCTSSQWTAEAEEEMKALTEGSSGDGIHFSTSTSRLSRRAAGPAAAREIAAEDRRRAHRHLAGYQNIDMEEEEQRLLADKTGDDSYWSTEDATVEEEEEEDYSSSNSRSSRSSSASSAGSEEEQEEEEEQATTSPSADGRCGFGAYARVRDEQEQQQKRHRKASRLEQADGDDSTDIPSSSSLPSSPTAPFSSVAGAPRSVWLDAMFFAFHENRMAANGCHHTLLGLRGPVSIQGPCGIIGFGLGEVAVSGFYLGRKQLTLWREDHRAVLVPMRRLKTKHAQDVALPPWPRQHPAPMTTDGDDGGVVSEASQAFAMNPEEYMSYRMPSTTNGTATAAPLRPGVFYDSAGAEEAEATEQALSWDAEGVFGVVDWAWVEATVKSWRHLFSNKLPPIVLVLQPASSAAVSSSTRSGMRLHQPTRRYYTSTRRGKNASEAEANSYMDIPMFVARRNAVSIDVALLPSIVPQIAAMGCGSVMVLGSANIGKSTLCRHLANTLLSQHGLCYWLELDVGQPEFGVPGQMGLYAVRRPLLRVGDTSCVETVWATFLGSTVATRCPLTAARAVATIAALAAEAQAHHPVVVNTHGWVLQSGRRLSVEVLRRLRPRHVIHLVKEAEEAWAKDTVALMNPLNGLNAEVVQRRFLVRRFLPSANTDGTTTMTPAIPPPSGDDVDAGAVQRGAKKGKGKHRGHPPSSCGSATAAATATTKSRLLCRLPYASSQRPAADGVEVDAPEWRGLVHTVRVERNPEHLKDLKRIKGGRGRQQRWQAYLDPLLQHYVKQGPRAEAPDIEPHGQRTKGVQVSKKTEEPSAEAAAEQTTTLLSAPLSALHRIVLAEREEDEEEVSIVAPSSTELRQELAASLEGAVVAVSFHRCSSSATESDRAIVCSLASLPLGFPVSCYGVVESTEAELVGGDALSSSSSPSSAVVKIRVPLPPAVVVAMMTDAADHQNTGKAEMELPSSAPPQASQTTTSVQISIAFSSMLRGDTSFLSEVM